MDIQETTVGEVIGAPPERIWMLVTDIALMPRFSRELVAVEWAAGFSAPMLGAQFIGRNRNSVIGEWSTLCRIVRFDEPREFGWTVGEPDNAAATWTFELTPTAMGTRLDHSVQIGPGPSGVTMLIDRSPHRADEIVQGRLRQLRKAMSATLAGIRELAERG